MYDKFVHSVKVPRLYKVAATIAKQYSEGVGSIKDLVYGGKRKHPNLKAIFALVTTLYDRSEEIENLLKRSKILEKETRLDPWLTKILIVELLWGKGALVGNSKPESTVRGYEQIFKAHLTDKPVKKTEGPLKPRYVRINTISLITEEAIQNFQDEGWVLSKFLDKNNYEGFLQKISNLEENDFMVDIHIPDLLIFPQKTEFYNHPAYNKASILLQDKASCLPVHILAPPPGSTVLDMCAAPGMKTTHLAAVMKNQGTVYAVEKDSKRYETLQAMIADAGATCVKTLNKDVLDCSAEDFPGVEYILVDPSCTGSGIAERFYSNEKIDPARVQKLAGFQIKILRTALKKYPDAKRVVYSTCSVLPEENEDVVRQVIETNYNFKLVPAKQFVSGGWKNFGSSDYGELGAHCLYTKPDDDFTNGFFVAVFERMAEGEENKFFNNKIYSYKRNIDKKERRMARKLERERRQIEENDAYEEFNNGNSEKDILDQEEMHKVDNQEVECVEEVKKKKKKKKHKENDLEIDKSSTEIVQNNASASNTEDTLNHTENGVTKRKKKRTLTEVVELDASVEIIEEVPKKKKKKKNEELQELIYVNDVESGTMKKCQIINDKKNKKKHSEIADETEDSSGNSQIQQTNKSKKKKKKKKHEDELIIIEDSIENNQAEETKKSKKKKKHQNESVLIEDSPDDTETRGKSRNKKKKHKDIEEVSNTFESLDLTNNSVKICGTDVSLKKKKKKNKDCVILNNEEEVIFISDSQNGAKSKSNKQKKHKEKCI